MNAINEQKIDKKVAVIIQWLERFKKSYSLGTMEKALMDAECAKADLEILRRDVWQHVQPENNYSRFNMMSFAASTFKAVSLSLLIVFLAVVPISRDIDAREFQVSYVNIKETKQPEKIQTTKITRSVMKNPEVSQNIHQGQPKRRKTAQKNNPKTDTKKLKPEIKSDVKSVKPKETHTLGYDKVYSLIQTGERALRNDSYIVIKN